MKHHRIYTLNGQEIVHVASYDTADECADMLPRQSPGAHRVKLGDGCLAVVEWASNTTAAQKARVELAARSHTHPASRDARATATVVVPVTRPASIPAPPPPPTRVESKPDPRDVAFALRFNGIKTTVATQCVSTGKTRGYAAEAYGAQYTAEGRTMSLPAWARSLECEVRAIHYHLELERPFEDIVKHFRLRAERLAGVR